MLQGCKGLSLFPLTGRALYNFLLFGCFVCVYPKFCWVHFIRYNSQTSFEAGCSTWWLWIHLLEQLNSFEVVWHCFSKLTLVSLRVSPVHNEVTAYQLLWEQTFRLWYFLAIFIYYISGLSFFFFWRNNWSMMINPNFFSHIKIFFNDLTFEYTDFLRVK